MKTSQFVRDQAKNTNLHNEACKSAVLELIKSAGQMQTMFNLANSPIASPDQRQVNLTPHLVQSHIVMLRGLAFVLDELLVSRGLRRVLRTKVVNSDQRGNGDKPPRTGPMPGGTDGG